MQKYSPMPLMAWRVAVWTHRLKVLPKLQGTDSIVALLQLLADHIRREPWTKTPWSIPGKIQRLCALLRRVGAAHAATDACGARQYGAASKQTKSQPQPAHQHQHSGESWRERTSSQEPAPFALHRLEVVAPGAREC